MRSLLVVACLPLWGCGLVLGIDDLVADRTSGPGGDCFDICGTPACGECPSPSAVAVPQSVRPYRIDAYEVTNAEYKAFLDAGVSLSHQGDKCAYNPSFEPGVMTEELLGILEGEGLDTTEVRTTLPECAGWLQTELDDFGANRPVRCVDVCDAREYCRWAHKRLCGAVAGDVLDVTQGAGTGRHIDPEQSEWYRACSNAGASLFPYGSAYEAGRCTDAGLSPNIVYDVGYSAGCEGGYAGLFDMSGNAGEWENSCTSYGGHPAAENCLVRGGSYYNGGPTDDGMLLTCTVFRDTLQSAPSTSIGFRCCSD